MKRTFALTKEEQLNFWKSVMITPTHPFRKTFSVTGKHSFNEKSIEEYCQKMIDKVENDKGEV